MAELRNIKGRYRGTAYDWIQDADGKWSRIPESMPMPDSMMLPDCVLDLLQKVTAPVVQSIFEKHLALNAVGGLVPPLNQHKLYIPHPEISWERTCQIVIRAFEAFDPALAKRVAEVIHDPSRIKLEKTKLGDAGGYCVPPGFQDNPRAVIHHRYENTINDAVYLAHELGHLVANDFAQEHGYRDVQVGALNPIREIPAMFTQIILYDYLLNKQPDKTLQIAACQHMVGETTRNLYVQQIGFAHSSENYENHLKSTLGKQWQSFENAKDRWPDLSALHSHCSASIIAAGLYFSGLGKKPTVFDELFKQGKDSDTLNVFAAAGINTEEQLTDFFTAAVKQASKPLEDIYMRHQALLQPKPQPNPKLEATL